MARTTINPSAVSKVPGLGSPNFLTLFLSIPDRSQRSYFWNLYFKISQNWTSKILGGPRALGEKNFLSPILMKLKIWNPYGLGISHMKFEQNRRQKYFFFPKVRTFDVFQEIETLKIRKTSKDLWKRKIFLSPILMKLKIWNPYGLGISHMKFEQNRRQKNFWHRRVPPLDFSQKFWKKFFCLRFCSNFMCEIPRL